LLFAGGDCVGAADGGVQAAGSTGLLPLRVPASVMIFPVHARSIAPLFASVPRASTNSPESLITPVESIVVAITLRKEFASTFTVPSTVPAAWMSTWLEVWSSSPLTMRSLTMRTTSLTSSVSPDATV
jgi:hypothetical protein